MKSRGILFSTPMVRALLAGRKTVTRRVVKRDTVAEVVEPYEHWEGYTFGSCAVDGTTSIVHCPYGKPGDRLWVRETWAPYPDPHAPPGDRPLVAYRATDEAQTRNVPWRPSIHMPRWAARITLDVVSVRVARLHDITEEDAIAEGVGELSYGGAEDVWLGGARDGGDTREPIEAFAGLWESINGPGSWAANPWVWRVEFSKFTKETSP